jgi:hypothetical protein
MGILGFVFGMMGMSFGLIAFTKVSALEKKLKETGVLDKDFNSEEELTLK